MAASKFTILARTFSSSGAQTQMIKTPVPVFGINGRYASAVYSAGMKSKEIDKIEKDFIQFQDALNKDKKFSQIMKDPTIKKNVKADSLRDIGQKMAFTKTATNTLCLLAENGRIKNFNEFMNTFKVVMAAHRGELPCLVTSAKPLAEAEKKEIEAALKKFAGSKTILLETKVEPKLIGGLTVSIGDKFIDMSMATRIKKYSDIVNSVV
ncbi:hypothetical protein RUM44_013396 [Polyplax serrata]|uniref:Oligomycin sensitivity conferral protein n=1 Tax=Polyplax serrata TaxID=468196 RepID=A0ABR1BE28_POLSC